VEIALNNPVARRKRPPMILTSASKGSDGSLSLCIRWPEFSSNQRPRVFCSRAFLIILLASDREVYRKSSMASAMARENLAAASCWAARDSPKWFEASSITTMSTSSSATSIVKWNSGARTVLCKAITSMSAACNNNATRM